MRPICGPNLPWNTPGPMTSSRTSPGPFPSSSRHIPLAGAYNFRDLGGLAAADGRVVRPRRVFRSDRLTGLTDEDRALLESLGIRRVFDLRSDLELAEHGAGDFSSAAGRHRHVPLVSISLSLSDPRIDWSKVDLGTRYLEMMVEGRDVIREIFAHLADTNDATLFHCTGGKDRTGVVAALLLRALGVDDETIVEDYAVSEKYLASFVEASRSLMEREGFDPQVVLYLCGSPAERMVKMLADLDARWGSVEGYLDWAGVDEATVASLRERLLG
jgi:protein-tyrosine phosphatase